jgi:hypothetical protein
MDRDWIATLFDRDCGEYDDIESKQIVGQNFCIEGMGRYVV